MANLIHTLIQKQVVDKLNNKMRVLRVENIEGEENIQRVKFCNIKWLKLYNRFMDGQIVIDYDVDGWVFLQVDEPLKVGDILSIHIPLFFYGTPYNTMEEWHNFVDEDGRNREDVKLPFIWLKTPSAINQKDIRSPFKYSARMKLFFVHYSDWTKKNEFRVNQSIEPLNALKEEFIKAINNNVMYFNRLSNEGESKDFPKFGKETEKGVEKTYFNSTLAGVMLDLSIEVKNDLCFC